MGFFCPRYAGRDDRVFRRRLVAEFSECLRYAAAHFGICRGSGDVEYRDEHDGADRHAGARHDGIWAFVFYLRSVAGAFSPGAFPFWSGAGGLRVRGGPQIGARGGMVYLADSSVAFSTGLRILSVVGITGVDAISPAS